MANSITKALMLKAQKGRLERLLKEAQQSSHRPVVSLSDLPLLDFITAVSPKYDRPDHLSPLADLLERVEVSSTRAVVSVPPRHGKTETLLHAIAWLLLRNPSMQIGYVSYGDRLTQQKSRLARDYAAKAGVEVRQDADSLHYWITPKGGGLLATSVRGPLTGAGVDLLIVDDPFKDRQDAESALNRQSLYDWYTSVASTRLEPGGSIIVVHTRWHDDDLIGRLKKITDNPYEVIHLKAIDDDGMSLWPKRWPVKSLEIKRKAVGEYDWASLYQGDPRPKGGELFREPARYETPRINGARFVIAVDPAASEKNHADYSAAVVMAVHGYEDDMSADILEVLRVQKEIPELCKELEALQARWPAPLHIEAVGVGKAVPQILRSINQKLNIKEIMPKGDKYTRAQPAAAAWNAGRIRVPADSRPWLNAFLLEVTSFTGINDPKDDQVDALAHAWLVARSVVSCGSSYSPLHDGEHDPREEALEKYLEQRLNDL